MLVSIGTEKEELSELKGQSYEILFLIIPLN
jgi:hypothetical protein